jgi:hypothetical protein
MTAKVLKFEPRPLRVWVGGVFLGDGLILGPPCAELVDWQTAAEWARELSAWHASDFRLPTLRELALIHCIYPQLCDEGAPWWSCELHPALKSDAMVWHLGQVIHWGTQHTAHAIAVRRLPKAVAHVERAAADGA